MFVDVSCWMPMVNQWLMMIHSSMVDGWKLNIGKHGWWSMTDSYWMSDSNDAWECLMMLETQAVVGASTAWGTVSCNEPLLPLAMTLKAQIHARRLNCMVRKGKPLISRRFCSWCWGAICICKLWQHFVWHCLCVFWPFTFGHFRIYLLHVCWIYLGLAQQSYPGWCTSPIKMAVPAPS